MEPGFLSAQQGATALLNLAMAVLTGATLSQAWLAGAPSGWAARKRALLPRLAWTMLALAALASVAVLWFEAALLAEVPPAHAGPEVLAVLTSTHYGRAWIGGAVALLAIAATSTLRHRLALGARLLAIGVFFYTRSMVSHAVGDGLVSLAVVLDWLHLVFISVWVGEVVVAGLVTLARVGQASVQEHADMARYVRALSTTATFALGAIVVSGLFNGWRGLGGIGNLAGTAYGTALVVKLAFVAGAAALGGFSRFFVMPAVLATLRGGTHGGRRRPERHFVFILRIETLALLGAIVAAAILSSTPPPMAA